MTVDILSQTFNTLQIFKINNNYSVEIRIEQVLEEFLLLKVSILENENIP